MIKKLLLITVSSFIITACGDKKNCESYDDVYGIHFGCDLSYTKKIPGVKLVSEFKEFRNSTYEISPYYVAPFDSGSEALLKLNDDKIFIVLLSKTYRSEQSKDNMPYDIEQILNDLEQKWGRIDGKNAILEASKTDLKNVDARSYNSISADITPSETIFIDKIHLEFGLDPNNSPVFSASFLGK